MVDYWPAIIAASAAIVGTVIGASLSMLSNWLERRNRRTLLLVDKLEQLTAANCEIAEWLKALWQCTTLQQTLSFSISPASMRLQALALLYFPHLRPPVAAYVNALKSYYCWATRCIRDDVQQPLGTQLRAFHAADATKQDERLQQLRDVLVSAIDQEAKSLLGHKRSSSNPITKAS